MSPYAATAEQLMRAGQLLRDLEVATKRLDAARARIKGTPLSDLAEQLADSAAMSTAEKHCEIVTRANNWLAVDVRNLQMAASLVEAEVLRKAGAP